MLQTQGAGIDDCYDCGHVEFLRLPARATHTYALAGFTGGPRRSKPPELPRPRQGHGDFHVYLRPAGPARARLGLCCCTHSQSNARAARAKRRLLDAAEAP